MKFIDDSMKEAIRREAAVREVFRQLHFGAYGEENDKRIKKLVIQLANSLHRKPNIPEKRIIGFVNTNNPKDKK